MSKKDNAGRKPRGLAGLATIEDSDTDDSMPVAVPETDNGTVLADKGAKSKGDAMGNFSVADVRKAAAFVNQIGGLDKALAVLQILKVAKEVQ